MFAILSNAHPVIVGSHYTGKVLSRHRTAKGAIAAAERAQRACRRAIRGSGYLDLTVGEIEHDDREANVARVATDGAAMRAARMAA